MFNTSSTNNLMYDISKCATRSYEDGVILTVCDKDMRMLGDLVVTPKRKVDKIFLVHFLKSLLQPKDTFDLLLTRAIAVLGEYAETLDIKYVFQLKKG